MPSSPPSDADSSHSSPPKMILRYGDGRPDVPIPHRPHYGAQQRTRSGSSTDGPRSPPLRHLARGDPHPPPPSPARRPPPPLLLAPAIPAQSRSRAPRTAAATTPRRPMFPFTTAPGPRRRPASPSPRRPNGRAPSTRPQSCTPPPHGSQRSHYAPPTMYHHPPTQMGPNGMIYSHSAPAGQYPPRLSHVRPLSVHRYYLPPPRSLGPRRAHGPRAPRPHARARRPRNAPAVPECVHRVPRDPQVRQHVLRPPRARPEGACHRTWRVSCLAFALNADSIDDDAGAEPRPVRHGRVPRGGGGGGAHGPDEEAVFPALLQLQKILPSYCVVPGLVGGEEAAPAALPHRRASWQRRIERGQQPMSDTVAQER